MLLAEWILENYKHEDYDLVRESLRNPVRLNDHTWRLTPDSISSWVDYTRNKRAEKAIVEESRKRQEAETPKHQFSPETEKLIQDYKNKLLDGIKTVPQMDETEIKATGQLRPIKSDYVPDPNNALILEKKLQAARSRGLDKLDFNQIKSFVVENQTVVARNYEEALEIYTEVYL